VRKQYSRRRELAAADDRNSIMRLAMEEYATLDALLGKQWQNDLLELQGNADEITRLGFLPEVRAEAVRQIETISNLRIASLSGSNSTAQVELQAIEGQRFDELRNVLSEEELATYLKTTEPLAREMESEGFAYRDSQEFLKPLLSANPLKPRQPSSRGQKTKL
jgi:hypothetical protein